MIPPFGGIFSSYPWMFWCSFKVWVCSKFKCYIAHMFWPSSWRFCSWFKCYIADMFWSYSWRFLLHIWTLSWSRLLTYIKLIFEPCIGWHNEVIVIVTMTKRVRVILIITVSSNDSDMNCVKTIIVSRQWYVNTSTCLSW